MPPQRDRHGIGCAVMMEAARILKAIGVESRARFASRWSGEEQGLLDPGLRRGALREPEAGVREVPVSTSIPARPYPRRQRLRPPPPRHPGERLRRSRTSASWGPPRQEPPKQERTAPRSTRPGCRASACYRIRSSPARYLAHQSRHLRANHRGGREEVGDRDCRGRVSPGDARRDAAAVQRGRHAASAGGAARNWHRTVKEREMAEERRGTDPGTR